MGRESDKMKGRQEGREKGRARCSWSSRQMVEQIWGQLLAGFLFSKQIVGATESTLQ
jgi:predicted nuclease of restriction endonuclease-like (RecB) superfamily